MNNNNLTSFNNNQSRDEAVKNGRKGGIKSGIARKRKKQLSDQAKMIMNLPIQEADTESIELLQQFGMDPTNETIMTVMICALMKKALSGDTNAIKAYIDLVDGKGDKKLDHDIQKAELELKKLEIQQKQKELSKNDATDRVIIVNDLPQCEKNTIS